MKALRAGMSLTVMTALLISAAARPAKRPPPVKGKVALTPEAAAKEAAERIAHIRLSGQVMSSPPDFSLLLGPSTAMTLRDWLQRLAKARNDDRVCAVALEVDGVGMGWGQAQELADALKRLNAVKPVYAHITSGGALSYLVGSAARELTMEPAGNLSITGLSAELTFYKGTLDWLGIRPQMMQIGRYKGAAEPFTRTGPSEELKGEHNRLLDDLYAQLCGQIARQRRLTVPHVEQAIDNGPHDGRGAMKYKLVDRLVGKGDWGDHVRQKVAGRKKKPVEWAANYAKKAVKQLDFSNPFAVFSMLMGGRPKTEIREPTIAIIHADGMIFSGSSGASLFGTRIVGARTMMKCFDQVARDDRIKAVILRIDSPGGSALGSELIYQAARKCAKKKPVIASISGLGASGGYYIALGAQKIIADPAAITGSIGVAGGKFATTGLMNKLGITTHAITRGRNAGMRLSRPWDDREQAVIRKLIQRVYNTFTSRVAESRGKRVKDVAAVAQGRIFTARQAVGNGLIDEIGGIREALLAAQAAAKIKSSYLLTLPKPKTLADMLYGGGSSSALPALAGEGQLLRQLGASSPLLPLAAHKRAGIGYLICLGRLMESETVLTALPYHVSIQP